MQLVKLPVPEIPRRILKDETGFQNPGREGGEVEGRGIAESETKKDEKGGGGVNIQVVGLPGVACLFQGRGKELCPTF